MNDDDLTKLATESQPQEPEENPQPQEQKSFNAKITFWVGILIVVIIAILLEIFWYTSLQQQQINLQTTVAQMQSSLADLKFRLQNQADETQSLVEKQTKVVANNEAAIVHLLKLTGGSQTDWILAEIEYLIRMANLTLHFQHNIPTTLALLQTADAHLRSIGSLKLLAIRKMLAHDIVALEAVPQVDIPGIYLRLQALDNQVEKLPLIEDDLKFKADTDADSQPVTSTNGKWRDTLNNSWRAIKKIIVVRRRQQPIEPLISLQRRNLLDLTIHVLFAQAQWALVQEQETIYKSCLQQIQSLIHSYFIQTNSKTQQLEQALDGLAQQNIAPTLPDISDSLEVIRQLQHYQIQKAVNKNIAKNDAKAVQSKEKLK